MSITYVQSVATWSGTTPAASGSFTPTAKDYILIYGADYTTAYPGSTLSFSGTGSYSALSQFDGAEADPSAVGVNISASSGAQTATVTSSAAGAFVVGFATEYSGAGKVVSVANNSQTKPGAGAGAIVGTSVTVATGQLLVAVCMDEDGSAGLTAATGTQRYSTGNYCVADYAGTGAAIQPTFTSTNGANDHFTVVQWLLDVPVFGTAAITEGADTVAGVGTDSVFGIAAITEGADTAAGVGTDSVFGIAAISEGSDTAAGVGTDSVFGISAATEGHDIVAAVGTDSVFGVAAVTESADTVSGVGNSGAVVTHGAGDDSRRPRARRRYGVRDGWRLLIFDTAAEAEAAERALSALKRSGVKALKKISVVPKPSETIDLPAFRIEATSSGDGARYDKFLQAGRFDSLAQLWTTLQARSPISLEVARRVARDREEEEIAVILLHLH